MMKLKGIEIRSRPKLPYVRNSTLKAYKAFGVGERARSLVPAINSIHTVYVVIG